MAWERAGQPALGQAPAAAGAMVGPALDGTGATTAPACPPDATARPAPLALLLVAGPRQPRLPAARVSPRRPPRPVPTDAERQIEDLGRQLAALGARVRFQPTVAHRFGAVPAAVACLAAAGATLLGLVWPLAGVALLLLLLWAAIRDADGGRSWLRRLIPASPGWALEAELQPAPETTLGPP